MKRALRTRTCGCRLVSVATAGQDAARVQCALLDTAQHYGSAMNERRSLATCESAIRHFSDGLERAAQPETTR